MTKRRWIGLCSAAAFVMGWNFPAMSEGVAARFQGLWQVTVTPDETTAHAGKNEFKDQLLIEESGLFTADQFGPMGFPSVAITVADESSPFSVTTSNDSQGTVTWSGNTDGSRISGTMVWVKSDGTVHRYTFVGTTD